MASNAPEHTVERKRAHPFPFRAAVVYGVVAAVGTYAAVVCFLGVHVLSLSGTTLGGVGARAFLFATLGDFFGSHVVLTDGVVPGVAGASVVPAPVYYLVPTLMLVVCGRLCASGTAASSDQEAFLQGAGVALGYGLVVASLLAVLLGAVEFVFVGLDPLSAFLFAGVVYPVLFGGLGGYTTRVW